MGKSKELAELGNMTWNDAALSSYDRRIELDGSIRLGTSTSANRSLDFSDSPDSDEKWQIYGWGDQLQFSKRDSSWTWASTPFAIDASGRVLIPEQPMFQAHSPADSTASGTTIVYGSTYTNIGNHYNTSTGIFTAPVAGRYLFTASCLFDYASGGYHRLDFKWNSTVSHRYGDTLENQAGPSYSSATISNIFNLSANDTIRMHNGSNVTTYGSNYGHFSGILLG